MPKLLFPSLVFVFPLMWFFFTPSTPETSTFQVTGIKEQNSNIAFVQDTIATICEGDFIEICGIPFGMEGEYEVICDIDSFVNLTLYVLDSVPHTFVEDTICQGEVLVIPIPLLFDTIFHTEEGSYTDSLLNVFGCDSIVFRDLTVIEQQGDMIVPDTICDGDNYMRGDSLFTPEDYDINNGFTGFFTVIFPDQFGCDSVIQVALEIQIPFEIAVQDTICDGEEYILGGDTLTASVQNYEIFSGGVRDCDTLYLLDLQVIKPIPLDTTLFLCPSESILFYDELISTTGSYEITGGGAFSCDTLFNLTVLPRDLVETPIDTNLCLGEVYVFRDSLFSEVGNYEYVVEDANSCDTLYLINLAPANSVEILLDETICENEIYDFFGTAYTESGAYYNYIVGSTRCDTVYQLDLEVLPLDSANLILELCPNDSIEFNGVIYTELGIYETLVNALVGCDTVYNVSVVAAEPIYVDTIFQLCPNDSIEFNGVTYFEPNTLSVSIAGETACDTIYELSIVEVEPIYELLQLDLCPSGQVNFNGTQYTTATNFELVVPGLTNCDTIYEVVIDALSPIELSIEADLCPNGIVEFNGTVYTESGVYMELVTGQGSCDTLYELTVLEGEPVSSEVELGLCPLGEVVFNGTVYTEPGVYMELVAGQGSCDTLYELTVLEGEPVSSEVELGLCPSGEVVFNGTVYTESGVYMELVAGQGSCDTLYELTVSAGEPISAEAEFELCPSGEVEFNGTVYTEVGEYMELVIGQDACDTLYELTIMEGMAIQADTVLDLCPSGMVEFNGVQYTTPTSTSDLVESNGLCDTLYNITVIAGSPIFADVTLPLCPGGEVMFGTVTYTATGMYEQSIFSSPQCEIIYTVTVEEATFEEIDTTLNFCPEMSVDFQDSTYNSAGNYEYFSLACDTLYNLIIEEYAPSMINNIDTFLCEGDLYTYLGENYPPNTDTVLYSGGVNGCDNRTELTIGLLPYIYRPTIDTICEGEDYFFEGLVFSESVVFDTLAMVMNGCDTLKNLNLTVLSSSQDMVFETLCPGDTIVVYGEQYTQPTEEMVNVSYTQFPCDSVQVQVVIEWELGDLQAFAGEDICILDSFYLLNAEPNPLPENIVGVWNYPSGVTLDDIASPIAFADQLNDCENIFNWAMVDTTCTSITASADVSVWYLENVNIQAVNDTFIVPADQLQLVGDVSMNDWPNDSVEVIVNDPPPGFSIDEAGVFSLLLDGNDVTIDYILQNTSCEKAEADTATIIVEVIDDLVEELHFGMTPGDADGLNDFFVIPELELPDVVNSEIVIISRWSDVVFQAAPYNNDWDGTYSKDRKLLAGGTYAYSLRYTLASGEEKTKKGTVTIFR